MERLGEELRSSETATQTKGRARDPRCTKSLSKAAIRKLWSVETDAYRDHLRRLDPESCHSRFGAAIADDMI